MSKRRLDRKAKREALRRRNIEREAKRDRGSGAKHLLNLTGYEHVNWYTLKEGRNYLDILPYEVSSDNHPDGIPIGEDDYKLEVWQHSNIGVNDEKVLCLKKTYGKKCPICEAQQELMDAGKEWDSKEIKALRPKLRCYYNVIDVSEDAETDEIQIFETSGAEGWFEDLLCKESKYSAKEEEIIAFYDLEEGKTVVCRTCKDTFNKRTFYKPERIDFEDREEEYSEDIYEEVFPLDQMLKIPTYKEVEKIFLGIEEEKEEREEREIKTKRKRKYRKETIQEDETIIEEQEEEEQEEEQEKEREEEQEENGNICPYDYIFGVDHNKHDGCEECSEEDFEECANEFDRIQEEKKKTSRRKRRK